MKVSMLATSSFFNTSGTSWRPLGIIVRGPGSGTGFGDRVCAATLAGGGHKIRHDETKNTLHRMMKWAGMPAQCEVFGLFAGVIPQAGLARMERGRKRQGIIPDFQLPGGGGESNSCLADLKFITGIVSRYPRNPQPRDEPKRAVQRRANLVNKEYEKHAVKLDVRHNGVPKAGRGEVQETGPVQQKLASHGDVEGWVFGVWGEASDEVHALIHRLAEARLLIMDQQPGRRKRRSLEVERARLVGSIRQQLSLVAVRANARLLINRIESHVGPGCQEAANRRRFAADEDRRQKAMRRAQALTLAQGRSLIRRGQFRTG